MPEPEINPLANANPEHEQSAHRVHLGKHVPSAHLADRYRCLMPCTIAQLQDLVRDFVHDRDWEQFHTPRNLTLALCGEAGELAAHMQWVTDEDINSAPEGSPLRTAIGHEVADVMIYLLRLADILDLNLDKEVQNKIRINEQRYPTDKARGSAAKYTAHGATKEQTFED